jgi:DNA-binding GntR family transcriptional regulator
VDAIESGDGDKAAAAVVGHMAGAAETLVSGAAADVSP